MDSEAKIGKSERSKSFRDEDYNTRRVFLRSYPLQWEGGGEKMDRAEALKKAENKNYGYGKKQVKRIILAVNHWSGGKILVLRKAKNKIAIYVVTCIPIAFRPPTALISA